VTPEIISANYDPLHPYVTDALERFGENAFDLAFVDGGGYRTDCAEIARLLVKDGGYILWHDIVSWRDNFPEFPSGRTYQSVFRGFPEYHYHDGRRTLLIVNRKNGPPYAREAENQAKRSLLEKIFDALLDEKIRYVVLRNAGDIPVRCSVENGVVLAVHPEDMSRAHTLLLKHLPEHYRDALTRAGLLHGALPADHYLLRPVDLHFEVVQGLYYTGRNRADKMALAGPLQESLFRRRRFVYDFWHFIPHEMDLFIHLLSHSLLDKNSLSPFYKTELENMVVHLDERHLLKELGLALPGFAEKALELIKSGNGHMLPGEYKIFLDSSWRRPSSCG